MLRAIAMVLVLLVPLAASAQSSAQEELRLGLDAWSAGKPAEALRHFRKAHEMAPSAEKVLYVARAMIETSPSDLDLVIGTHVAEWVGRARGGETPEWQLCVSVVQALARAAGDYRQRVQRLETRVRELEEESRRFASTFAAKKAELEKALAETKVMKEQLLQHQLRMKQ